MILFGIVGGLFVLIYLIVNQVQNRFDIFLFPREVIIALFYVYGTCGYPIVISGKLLMNDALYCTGIFFLCLSNVLIYSYFEQPTDRMEGVKSLSVVVSKKFTFISATTASILAGSVFLFGLILASQFLYFAIIGLVISLVLLHILLFRKFYTQKKLYGIIADLSFILLWVVCLF
jgi:4-hydroxybenzoate polyprenyltransferase